MGCHKRGQKYRRLWQPISTYEQILSAPCPTKVKRYAHMAWRCLFWLAVATGNRAKHVTHELIRKVSLTERSVLVWWGPRKVFTSTTNDALEYMFDWSLPPPEDVRGDRFGGVPHGGPVQRSLTGIVSGLRVRPGRQRLDLAGFLDPAPLLVPAETHGGGAEGPHSGATQHRVWIVAKRAFRAAAQRRPRTINW